MYNSIYVFTSTNYIKKLKLGELVALHQNVTTSLNGTNTNFDTLLSLYEKTIQGTTSKATMLACNDDGWNQISILTSTPLKANHTYVFVS